MSMQESQEELFEDSHPGTHSSTQPAQWHHSVDLAHSAGGSARLLAGHHQGAHHVHREHLPLFAGVRAGEVHTSTQAHKVHTRCTQAGNLPAFTLCAPK